MLRIPYESNGSEVGKINPHYDSKKKRSVVSVFFTYDLLCFFNESIRLLNKKLFPMLGQTFLFPVKFY